MIKLELRLAHNVYFHVPPSAFTVTIVDSIERKNISGTALPNAVILYMNAMLKIGLGILH